MLLACGLALPPAQAFASPADDLAREIRAVLKKKRPRPSARLFAPSSFWNVRVSGAMLDPTSAARVDLLADLIEKRKRTLPLLNGGYPNINADEFSTPIYRVGPNVERVPVRVRSDRGRGAFERVAAQGVPIPDHATPAVGSDGHMTIYQRSTDTLWEFWRARKTASGWHAGWGGAMQGVSRSPGYYTADAWPRLISPEGWNWGSTATSLPVAGGTVTRRELASGRIRHALAVAIPWACSGVFTWPAQRTDGTSRLANCIPHGTRLRIDPALDLKTLPLHPVARMLAEAAQRHGIVIRDSTRVSVAFFLESPPTGEPSPYTGPGGLYGGTPSWQVLEGFPWRSLQLLPLRLCTMRPCR